MTVHQGNPSFYHVANTFTLHAQILAEHLFVVAAAFAGSGLDARYESEHAAVHVSSQPHGQGWPL